MNPTILWDIAPCSPYVNRRFGRTCHCICLTTCFTLISCSADFLPWIWRWWFPPKRHFTYGQHVPVSQKVENYQWGSLRADAMSVSYYMVRLIVDKSICLVCRTCDAMWYGRRETATLISNKAYSKVMSSKVWNALLQIVHVLKGCRW
jgi:hypothetical protein